MKQFTLLSAVLILLCIACSKDKTESPFIGTFVGDYKEMVGGGSVSLGDVTVEIEGKTNNKLGVKIDLGPAAFTLNAEVVTNEEIFFPPQEYFDDEVSGTGTLTENDQKVTIEMERTTGPLKTFRFTGVRQ